MTTTGSAGPQSMRFALHEVLSGMLATTEAEDFSDDPARLASMFADLSGRFTLFAPLSVGVDAGAVSSALQSLEQKNVLTHADGRYTLTELGRSNCVGSKRTLFNQGDREQLEEAARTFDAL